jgi:hypothetical protein
VKSLARPSFFRVFDLLLSTTNPGLKLSSWTRDGIEWMRERHSFAGFNHGQTIEIVTMTRPGKRGWSLMVVKEYWWVGKDSKPVKALRWAKPIEGQRIRIIEWFRAQEARLPLRIGAHESIPLNESAAAQDVEIFDETDDD